MIHDCSNLPNATVFIENRLVFWSVPPNYSLPEDPTRIYLCSDETLVYEQFFADFGPLNVACVIRFCRQLSLLLKDPLNAEKLIIYHTSSHGHRRSNGAVLMCCFAMIELKRNVIEAYKPFIGCSPPLVSFRDAAFGVCTFPLTVLDCVRGTARALNLQHFIPETFDIDEYLHLDKIENGDVSWIVPQKFIGFSGPLSQRREIEPGVFTMNAEDYVRLFKRLGVTAVIRFNNPLYDRNIFIKNGIHHFDLFYEDGGNPPEEIMEKFIHICEREGGAIAVHCKAGLGRTGTNIGAYMMKHYGYTALEAIAWMRVCRPGSVVGPQQQFLLDAQARLWRSGETYRNQRGGAKPVGVQHGNDNEGLDNQSVNSNLSVTSSLGHMTQGGVGVGETTTEAEKEEGRLCELIPDDVSCISHSTTHSRTHSRRSSHISTSGGSFDALTTTVNDDLSSYIQDQNSCQNTNQNNNQNNNQMNNQGQRQGNTNLLLMQDGMEIRQKVEIRYDKIRISGSNDFSNLSKNKTEIHNWSRTHRSSFERGYSSSSMDVRKGYRNRSPLRKRLPNASSERKPTHTQRTFTKEMVYKKDRNDTDDHDDDDTTATIQGFQDYFGIKDNVEGVDEGGGVLKNERKNTQQQRNKHNKQSSLPSPKSTSSPTTTKSSSSSSDLNNLLKSARSPLIRTQQFKKEKQNIVNHNKGWGKRGSPPSRNGSNNNGRDGCEIEQKPTNAKGVESKRSSNGFRSMTPLTGGQSDLDDISVQGRPQLFSESTSSQASQRSRSPASPMSPSSPPQLSPPSFKESC